MVSIFEFVLKPIEEYIGEFIDVHLLADIGGIAVIVLEGIAEIFRVVVFLL